MTIHIKDGKEHDISYEEIDGLDEIDGDCQSALVFCNTCKKWEWHMLDRSIAAPWDIGDEERKPPKPFFRGLQDLD